MELRVGQWRRIAPKRQGGKHMRFGWLFCLAFLACGAARAQPILNPPILNQDAVPGLDAAGRAEYTQWTQTDTPRVFALGSNGRMGWYSGGKTLDVARAGAVKLCTEHGGTECRPYAEDLSVVWPGREWHPQPPPAPLVDTINYGFYPDARFLWYGPAAAKGVVVWSHGSGAWDQDSRGQQPPAFLRVFNNAGYDVIRFDRAPAVDTLIRAGGWLHDELPVLRRSGYRQIVAAGQSHGGWTSLQLLDVAGLADVVIAVAPAAHGSGASPNLAAQEDDLRAVVAGAAASRTRVAFIQFLADPFAADPDGRIALMERLRPKTGGMLLIDRPPGLKGHFASITDSFRRRFSGCLLAFATAPQPPTTCSDPE